MAATFTIGGTAKSGAIEIRVDQVSLNRAIAAAREFGRKAVQEMGGALYREAEAIMADSKAECPVRLGPLRASGHVQPPRVEAGEIVLELGYGGTALEYALRQHEELDYHHTVGKAKYLEDPYRRHLRGLDERLAADLKRRLERTAA